MSKPLKIVQYKYYLKESSKDGIISFVGSNPSSKASFFYRAFIDQSLRNIMKRRFEECFSYSNTQGSNHLRQAISGLFIDNIRVSADSILITNGSQQAISLIAQTLIRPNDNVLVDHTSYLGIEKPLKDSRARIQSFPKPLHELSYSGIEKVIKYVQPKILYVIPDFANPTGQSLTGELRTFLAEFAERYRFFLVEDRSYSCLAYPYNPLLPSLLSLSSDTLSIGSISKCIAPGLRIGWIASAQINNINKLVLQKETVDLGSSMLVQEISASILEELRKSPKLMDTIKAFYQRRMELLLSSLEKYMPEDFSWTIPHGGFFVWVNGPKSLDSRSFFQRALLNGVGFTPGCLFYYKKPQNNTFRLSISDVPDTDIEEGVKRLAKAASEELSQIHHSS